MELLALISMMHLLLVGAPDTQSPLAITVPNLEPGQDESAYVYACQSESASRLLLDVWHGTGEDGRDWLARWTMGTPGSEIPAWAECVYYDSVAFAGTPLKVVGRWNELQDTRYETSQTVYLTETAIEVDSKSYIVFSFFDRDVFAR